jgi:hypothetical protein
MIYGIMPNTSNNFSNSPPITPIQIPQNAHPEYIQGIKDALKLWENKKAQDMHKLH